jgi:hypothetical protein
MRGDVRNLCHAEGDRPEGYTEADITACWHERLGRCPESVRY